MRILLLLLVVSAIGAGFGWGHLPEDVRSDLNVFADRSADKLVDTARQELVPEDPREHRRIVIEKLEDLSSGLQYRRAIDDGKLTEDELAAFLEEESGADEAERIMAVVAGTDVDSMLMEVDELIEELSEWNEKDPLTHDVTEKVVDSLLPDGTIDCEKLCSVPAQ